MYNCWRVIPDLKGNSIKSAEGFLNFSWGVCPETQGSIPPNCLVQACNTSESTEAHLHPRGYYLEFASTPLPSPNLFIRHCENSDIINLCIILILFSLSRYIDVQNLIAVFSQRMLMAEAPQQQQ